MLEAKPLLDQPLNNREKIAFIFSTQLGDSLISMVTVHNLRRKGYDVTVFSDQMFAMKNWFVNDKIYPYPGQGQIKSILSTYDTLIFTYPHDIIGQADLWHSRVVILSLSPLSKAKKSMVDIQVDISQQELYLTNLVRVNDLIPPSKMQPGKYVNRVIIHPTSRQKFRSWQQEKFIELAKKLQSLSYQPSFIVSPSEQQDWLLVRKEGLELPYLASLDKIANYIYESSWFIGNDSGLGHLASNLGLSTITLAVRASLAKQWRPSWMPGVVVLPPSWLITRPLKEKFWKNFISVNSVLKICTKQPWTKII